MSERTHVPRRPFFTLFAITSSQVHILELEGIGRNLTSDIYCSTFSAPQGGRLQLEVIHKRQSNQTKLTKPTKPNLQLVLKVNFMDIKDTYFLVFVHHTWILVLCTLIMIFSGHISAIFYMVKLVRLTQIVPPQSCSFMGGVDKGCATAGKYENVTNSFTKKWTHKSIE